ncbi:alkaline phosphatase family protein [Natrialba sp. PRR66]|uniref:alkaline phosphatase family protein n=1 Tax=Natrialba sp. PRR66 TaxID=3098146 RepID=UPI002B1E497C|nr:alkaline phosphatase family protein [Natrialba sp. PRR66]
MSETLCVLGLDAADYRLATRWQCSNLLLETNAELESISYSLDVPATLEVWPSIATGTPPAEHGVVLDSVGWDNTSGLNVLVRMAQLLPDAASERLATAKERLDEGGFPYTDDPTVFDDGSVRNWPGVTPALDWERESEWFEQATEGRMATAEFMRRYFGSTGSCLGWLAGQALSDVPIAGVHAHILDHAGHMYARRPAELRTVYERIDALVGWLRSRVDRLVIVSDHGMQTTATEDPEPGVHSEHALVATTEPGPLPTDVLSVRPWLEDRIEADGEGTSDPTASVDAPREHLEDLGYL